MNVSLQFLTITHIPCFLLLLSGVWLVACSVFDRPAGPGRLLYDSVADLNYSIEDPVDAFLSSIDFDFE